ncbi:uncharacterized protein EI97DRAFT_371942 [Westerdykella ornata]|uniref:Uncharacterized protein n=1 Tax=Westerdykella ornata TaxID=318751 RepID=A0A6A6JRC7_WESOR|nr:uncharacterized protein EI97DRAFT_371942 [Westerdykella ornata]KAF2278663.1 hypothetical protein EI97DRAFT_371942 [Westerdykella ornata]
MLWRTVFLSTALSLCSPSVARVAPMITWVEDGYNLIAKLPCVSCPFLYQDTSKGEDQRWSKKTAANSLLLNISLPYTTPTLSINQSPLPPPASTTKLPLIHAPQVYHDISQADLTSLISSNQLDTSGSASFGLSYAYSIRHIPGKPALLFQFDVLEILSDVPPEAPVRFKLQASSQQMLQIVLLRKPLLSAADPDDAYEIVRAELVPRTEAAKTAAAQQRRTMVYSDWDSFGRKGTAAHFASSFGDWLVGYLDSGVWGLVVFVLGVMAVFVVVCVACMFGCEVCSDDYERAQNGKVREGRKRRGRGRAADVESGWRERTRGKGKGRFKTPEELGLLGRGRVVGVGKSD